METRKNSISIITTFMNYDCESLLIWSVLN